MPRNSPRLDRKAFNVGLTALDRQRLEELSLWLSLSLTDTIRHVVRMHHHLATELRSGGKLLIRQQDGTETAIVMHMMEDT